MTSYQIKFGELQGKKSGLGEPVEGHLFGPP